MISNSYSNKVLDALMGVSAFSTPSNVYLGLCANEPATDGSLTNAAEPTSVESYERKLVSGTSSSASKYFGNASSGIIKNTDEIQLKTARQDYPDKINYWFLSTTQSGGTAYMWGRIKDVLSATQTVTGFMAESTYNTYTASTTVDILGLKANETYIVSWDDKEYEETAYLYEKDGVSYIRLGNTLASGGEKEDDKPFGVIYNVVTDGTETTGNLTVYSLTGEASHTIAIYGIGIVIKKATVPTFYEGELQARLDA